MYSCEILFPAHHQITITKNPSAAEGRHQHTFFELDCVKVGRCLAELGGAFVFSDRWFRCFFAAWCSSPCSSKSRLHLVSASDRTWYSWATAFFFFWQQYFLWIFSAVCLCQGKHWLPDQPDWKCRSWYLGTAWYNGTGMSEIRSIQWQNAVSSVAYTFL